MGDKAVTWSLWGQAFEAERTVILKTTMPKFAWHIWGPENVTVDDIRDCYGKRGLQEARVKS